MLLKITQDIGKTRNINSSMIERLSVGWYAIQARHIKTFALGF